MTGIYIFIQVLQLLKVWKFSVTFQDEFGDRIFAKYDACSICWGYLFEIFRHSFGTILTLHLYIAFIYHVSIVFVYVCCNNLLFAEVSGKLVLTGIYVVDVMTYHRTYPEQDG